MIRRTPKKYIRRSPYRRSLNRRSLSRRSLSRRSLSRRSLSRRILGDMEMKSSAELLARFEETTRRMDELMNIPDDVSSSTRYTNRVAAMLGVVNRYIVHIRENMDAPRHDMVQPDLYLDLLEKRFIGKTKRSIRKNKKI